MDVYLDVGDEGRRVLSLSFDVQSVHFNLLPVQWLDQGDLTVAVDGKLGRVVELTILKLVVNETMKLTSFLFAFTAF